MDDLHNDDRSTRGRPRLTERAKEIAGRITQARKLAGMSVDDCVRALHLSKNQYCYIERQCSPTQEAAYLSRIAELFKVSLNWLADGSGAEGKPQAATAFATLSVEEAQWLGARAKARREELGLSRMEMVELIGEASAINLMMWEKSLPRKRRPVEVAWETALRVPEGWLRHTYLKAFPPHPFPFLESAHGMTVAREMCAVCSWFSRKNPYHRTIEHDALTGSEKRMVDIMLHRFGVYGEDASTLQQIGDRIGLTRERVRQIEAEFIANLDECTIAAPALDHLKSAIQANLPCTVEELDRTYRDLLGESLSVIGADRFAREVMGRNLVRVLVNPANMQGHNTRMAVPDDAPDPAELRAVRQVAVSMVRISGAAQVHFVAGMSSAVLKRGVTPDEVVRSCQVFRHFEWLSEEDGWFWFGPAAENRAKTAALKVLSVATRNVDVEEIHDAMSRARLTRYEPDKPRPFLLDAPLSVLREVLARIPGIEKLQFNDFRLDILISPEEVLSDTELAIYRVIKSHGGVATRQTIAEEALAMLDVTPMALNFALDGSPIFVRLDKGIWAIRCNRLDANAITAAIERSAATAGGNAKFVAETPAPVDGWWTVRVTVPESAFKRRHWIVPVAVENLLHPGEYLVDGYTEPATYLIGVNANLAGFVGKLIDAGIAANEVFLLRIHATERRLRVEKLPQPDSVTSAMPGGDSALAP